MRIRALETYPATLDGSTIVRLVNGEEYDVPSQNMTPQLAQTLIVAGLAEEVGAASADNTSSNVDSAAVPVASNDVEQITEQPVQQQQVQQGQERKKTPRKQ